MHPRLQPSNAIYSRHQAHVMRVDEAEVLEAEAVLLMYARRSSRSSSGSSHSSQDSGSSHNGDCSDKSDCSDCSDYSDC